MAQDIQDTRKVVRDWREYLHDMGGYGRVFAWIWKELIDARTKVWIRRMMWLLLIDAVFIMIGPWAQRFVFDGVAQRNADLIIFGIGAYIGSVVLQRTVGYWALVCREWVSGLNIGNLDKRLSELFMGRSMGQHLQEHGYLSAANVEKGRNRVHSLEELILFNASQNVLHWVISFALLSILSPTAGLIMTGAFAIHIVSALYLSVNANQVMTPLDKEFRRINRYRVERWDNVERVKANGKEVYETSFMQQWFDRLIAEDRTFWIWFLRHMITRGGVTSVAVGGVMAYGSWMVWNNVWTIGVLYPLFAWAMRVRDGFGQLSDIERQIGNQVPAIKSMMETLSIPTDVQNGSISADTLGATVRIAFDGISHGYVAPNGQRNEVVRNVSFAVEPGRPVAIIGKSGAGKTTIMRLFLRYMDPNNGGRILLNGLDMREFDLPSLKRIIGYVPQQAQILDGTLRYNLTYGLSDEERAALTDEALWELIRVLGIDFGARLMNGLDTNVGRGGVKLSGGEAQRVMIGAAALKHPKIMIIDEATSSLDALTERLVHDGLKRVLQPTMSTLIITHRLATVRDIGKTFIVLRPAEECADGKPQIEATASSYEELYRLSQTFRRLADEQGIVIDPLKPSGRDRPLN